METNGDKISQTVLNMKFSDNCLAIPTLNMFHLNTFRIAN